MTPYTYLIGWSHLDRWYYGVRFANKVAPEDDLWKVYFTSSKHVKAFRDEHGEPDVVQVRKVFADRTAACRHEMTVLRRLKVESSAMWINQKVPGNPWDREGKHHSPESIAKMSQKAKGRPAWNKGAQLSADTRAKISQAARNRARKPVTVVPAVDLSVKDEDFIRDPNAPTSASRMTLTRVGCSDYAEFRGVILNGLQRGLSIKAIALDMGIDNATVMKHSGLMRESTVFKKNYRRAYAGKPKSAAHAAKMKKPKSEAHAQTMRTNWHASRGLTK